MGTRPPGRPSAASYPGGRFVPVTEEAQRGRIRNLGARWHLMAVLGLLSASSGCGGKTLGTAPSDGGSGIDASTDDGGSGSGEAASSSGSSGGGMVCVPKTCQSLGYTCSANSDSCGGVIHCGTCSGTEFCGGGGFSKCGGNVGQVPDGGTCFSGCCPKTCRDYPVGTCGIQSDGCGGVTETCALTDAGLCPAGEFCGGGGQGTCGVGSSSEGGSDSGGDATTAGSSVCVPGAMQCTAGTGTARVCLANGQWDSFVAACPPCLQGGPPVPGCWSPILLLRVTAGRSHLPRAGDRPIASSFSQALRAMRVRLPPEAACVSFCDFLRTFQPRFAP